VMICAMHLRAVHRHFIMGGGKASRPGRKNSDRIAANGA
jgi:hypothetical protein